MMVAARALTVSILFKFNANAYDACSIQCYVQTIIRIERGGDYTSDCRQHVDVKLQWVLKHQNKQIMMMMMMIVYLFMATCLFPGHALTSFSRTVRGSPSCNC